MGWKFVVNGGCGIFVFFVELGLFVDDYYGNVDFKDYVVVVD